MDSKRARVGFARALAVLIGLGAAGCGDAELDVPREEPPGPRPAAAFFGDTDLIHLKSPRRCEHLDSSFGVVELTWEKSGEARVVVAVMRAQPVTEGREIRNKEDIVWVWTTAGDRSDGGWLAWSDGFTPDPETGLPGGPPPALAELGTGVGLYWLVTWAWDDERALSYSSEMRPFFLGPMGEGQQALASPDACCRAEVTDQEWLGYWCRPMVDIDEQPDAKPHETEHGCMGFLDLCGWADEG